jgi:hypothetical protein
MIEMHHIEPETGCCARCGAPASRIEDAKTASTCAVVPYEILIRIECDALAPNHARSIIEPALDRLRRVHPSTRIEHVRRAAGREGNP